MKSEISLKHIGINAKSSEEAQKMAELFSVLLGCSTINGGHSVFAGTLIEVMKQDGRGTHGHIALQVDSIESSIPDFERRGFRFDKDSVQYDAKGNMTVLYLQGEYGGFAVHLAR